MSTDVFRRYIDIVTESAAHAVTEMDKSQPSHGRDGHVSHSTYGSRDKEGSDYFKGKELPAKPITLKKMEKDALDILKKQGVAEGKKSLADYIAESERAYSQPVPGDYFAINIREETLFETWVCDETADGIVIYADDAGLALLERYGYLGEAISEGHDFEIDSDEDSVDVVDQGEYDQEGDMAKDDLATIVRAARRLTGMLDDNDNLPEWVQAKITKAADYVDTAADYMESNREQDMAEGKKSDRYHIVGKDGKPVNLASYADRASAIKDRDEKYPGAVVQQVGPRGKVKGVAEGFPHDVDHMPGPVIRNADMTTDNVKTKDKAEWDRATDSINARVFDDMSEFRTDSKGETVVGDSAVWAKWDNATQTGWFNAKGRPLKPWPVKEQGVAEGFDNDTTGPATWNGHKVVANRKTSKGSFLILQNKNDGKYEIHKQNPSVVGGLEFMSVHKTPEEMQAAFRQLTGVDESKQGMAEAKYQGREVPLGKPMKGDVKKSKVYVRGPKGNVVKVNFGQKGMKIKKNIPGRRKNFRARHNCANPGPRWKARYWSCRAW